MIFFSKPICAYSTFSKSNVIICQLISLKSAAESFNHPCTHKQKGRAVYLTIPEHVSKLIKPNEKGKYTVVYAKVLLGDEDPDKDGVSLSYKDPNKFLKYGHKKYDDNGSTMYAIYNLSQVYPMYAVEYTL